MATSNRGSKAVAVIIIVVGAIMVVAGVVTWFAVSNQLAAEKITVSEDASFLAGDEVDGPFSAYAQADIINKHALEATGGKTYAELGQDDPLRQTAMQASFLRASLYTSVVAFGVAFMAAVIGLVFILIGRALMSMERARASLDSARTPVRGR